jgi:hypothetical protein
MQINCYVMGNTNMNTVQINCYVIEHTCMTTLLTRPCRCASLRTSDNLLMRLPCRFTEQSDSHARIDASML